VIPLVQGTCDANFYEVEALLKKFLDAGEEIGASIAVNVDGEDVVDLYGRYADADTNCPWQEDTIANLFSTTKNVASLAVLTLIDAKEMSVHDRASKHWPEFRVNGKEDIEIRHILSHTFGVSRFEDPITLEDLSDTQG
jgi:CubicO group peptidase (beta-lactamase class C family)